MKKNWGGQAMMIFIYLFLITLAFLTFYPFWNSLVISFNSGRDTVTGGITFWPREFTLENYQIVFQDQRLMNAFFISVLRTVIGTFSSIMLTAMAAYGMSKRELIGRKFITIFFHPHDVLQRRLDSNFFSGTFTWTDGFFLGNDHSWSDQCLEYDHLPYVLSATAERIGRFSEN
jgi:ABC-type sugar transport system permease subunit